MFLMRHLCLMAITKRGNFTDKEIDLVEEDSTNDAVINGDSV